jgi:predicted nucleic acid-binding Zn ribbon protein
MFCILNHPILMCELCGSPIYERTGFNQKYCQDPCSKIIGNEKNRLRVLAYNKRWKHLGRAVQRESLGSGGISSPHRKEDFEEEYQIIQNEKRRLGLK